MSDTLLIEQLSALRQQQQHLHDTDWRTLLLSGGTLSSATNTNLSLPPSQSPGGSSQWSLPPLPSHEAAVASATLQGLNLSGDSLLMAQLLRKQRMDLVGSADKTLFSNHPLMRAGLNQDLLFSSSSIAPDKALAAALDPERVVPEPLRGPKIGKGQGGGFPLPAPPCIKKKKLLQEVEDSCSMPAPPPKKKKLSSSGNSSFPLPNKDAEPRQMAPKLISFQRTWGKLEKCKMRNELFRRKLERGEVQLTGVTRSVLQQAKKNLSTTTRGVQGQAGQGQPNASKVSA